MQLRKPAKMFTTLSRKMMLRLMKSRAEKHSGCRIDVARLAIDPEYASAIRVLAQFTLDEELHAVSDLARYASTRIYPAQRSLQGDEHEADAPLPAHLAQVLPFRARVAV